MGTAVDGVKGSKERRSIALCGVHTEKRNCPRGWGSMVGSDRLNVPAIDNSSH